MGSKGGDVSSRELLNAKLSGGLDALAGLGPADEEKLNDNRDYNCLVPNPRALSFGAVTSRDRRRLCCRLTGWARQKSCPLRACAQVPPIDVASCER